MLELSELANNFEDFAKKQKPLKEEDGKINWCSDESWRIKTQNYWPIFL